MIDGKLEEGGSLQPKALSEPRLLEYQYNPNQFSVIFASDRDIAFCIRTCQELNLKKYPCIVHIHCNDLRWQEAPIFNECYNIAVASTHPLPLENNRSYFVTDQHHLIYDNNALTIDQGSDHNGTFADSIDQIVIDTNVSINTLIGFKNSKLPRNIDQWISSVTEILFEDGRQNHQALTNLRFMQRTEMLKSLKRNALVKTKPAAAQFSSASRFGFEEKSLVKKMKEYSGINFQDYKQSWLLKQIQKRCSILNIPTTNDYIQYCDNNSEEWNHLHSQIFTPVPRHDDFSKILRDARALFEKENIISLTEDTSHYRVWTPNCGYGEVSYAIAVAWHLAVNQKPIKIFATDISEKAINYASTGLDTKCLDEIYGSVVLGLFGKHKNGLRAAPLVRKNISFAVHDLLQMVGFHQLQLVVCSESLEKYTEQTRRKLLNIFNNSLNQHGFFWMYGNDEMDLSAAGFEKSPLIPGLYRKIQALPMQVMDSSKLSRITGKHKHYAPPLQSLLQEHKRRNRYSDYHYILDKLIDQHMPAGIVFDRDGKLIHILGNVTDYTDTLSATGHFETNVRRIMKKPLRSWIVGAISDLVDNGTSRSISIPWKKNNEDISLTVELKSYNNPENNGTFGVILFHESKRPYENHGQHAKLEDPSKQSNLVYIQQLENDLLQLQKESNHSNTVLEEQITTLHQMISDLVLSNDQMQEINEQATSRYQILSTAYEKCRQLLSPPSSGNGTHVTAMALVDYKWEIKFYNTAMKQHLHLNTEKSTINDIRTFAEFLGGEKFLEAISSCLLNKHSESTHTANNELLTVHPLPNNEVMLTIRVQKTIAQKPSSSMLNP